MQTFHDALLAHGLRPKRPPAPDGKIYRCGTEDHPRKRNGAYMLAPDGLFGWFRNWATDETPVLWHADGAVREARPIDEDAIRRRIEEHREARRRATAEARVFYEFCDPLRGGHPYLASHGLDMTGCEGLRVDNEGWLVIPAFRAGNLQSVQRIAPDGTKRFWPGASMSGVQYVVERRGASITVLCEGLATGLAIYAAAPLTRVIVTFTAGNMLKVAQDGSWRGFVVVAADNDHQTAERIGRNPGVDAANEAAKAIGCGVLVPDGMQGTDWCDWREERYAERLRTSQGYGKRPVTEGSIRRAVDAQLAREVQRAAVFVVPSKRHA